MVCGVGKFIYESHRLMDSMNGMYIRVHENLSGGLGRKQGDIKIDLNVSGLCKEINEVAREAEFYM